MLGVRKGSRRKETKRETTDLPIRCQWILFWKRDLNFVSFSDRRDP